jgi:hypothetical protein
MAEHSLCLMVHHEIIQYKILCLVTVSTFICDYTSDVHKAQSMNSTVRVCCKDQLDSAVFVEINKYLLCEL